MKKSKKPPTLLEKLMGTLQTRIERHDINIDMLTTEYKAAVKIQRQKKNAARVQLKALMKS